MPHNYVRVRLDNGTEKTVTDVVAKRYGYKPLKKDTHNRDGSIKPPKLRVPLGGAASADHTNPEARPASDAPQEG